MPFELHHPIATDHPLLLEAKHVSQIDLAPMPIAIGNLICVYFIDDIQLLGAEHFFIMPSAKRLIKGSAMEA
jgi:hypothetical protein